jgi:hypothetical protein
LYFISQLIAFGHVSGICTMKDHASVHDHVSAKFQT